MLRFLAILVGDDVGVDVGDHGQEAAGGHGRAPGGADDDQRLVGKAVVPLEGRGRASLQVGHDVPARGADTQQDLHDSRHRLLGRQLQR
jgi:hypothetical protein